MLGIVSTKILNFCHMPTVLYNLRTLIAIMIWVIETHKGCVTYIIVSLHSEYSFT